MEKKVEYKINRFPICEVVHYACAITNGYTEDQAKAFAHATAIFYACCKFGYFRNRRYKSKPNMNTDNLEKFRFFNRIFNVKNVNGVKLPVMGGKIIYPSDFDKSLRSKLSQEEIDAILSYAVEYVSQFGKISNPYKIYEKVRDEWRTNVFWDKITSEYKQKTA